MKSYGGLFDKITHSEHLWRSMELAARGKRDRGSVQRFLGNAEYELERLRSELCDGTYRPRPYQQFRIMDPKPRTISCADFRDRVVHHAICDLVGPLLERRFVHHSYACRKGKGSHRAVLQSQRYCRRFRYFLKTDIRTFFDSVNHDVLELLLVRSFRESRLLRLMSVILRHPLPGQKPSRGLPIGNLTSQWWANLYLDEMDHLAKDVWGLKGYIRYMDDMAFWSDSKERLWRVREELSQYLAEHRKLVLKESATILGVCSDGVPLLGMRVFPDYLRLQHKRLWRTRRLVQRREREYQTGGIEAEELVASVQASVAIVRFFGMKNIVRSRMIV